MRQKNKDLNSINNYAKYSGIAFEMLGIIVLGVWGGVKLDAAVGTQHIFTIVLSLCAIAIALYSVFRRLGK